MHRLRNRMKEQTDREERIRQTDKPIPKNRQTEKKEIDRQRNKQTNMKDNRQTVKKEIDR